MAIPSFIRTSDAETAEQLRECGYYEVTDKSATGYYTFVNSIDVRFDTLGIDPKKISYTNKLFV